MLLLYYVVTDQMLLSLWHDIVEIHAVNETCTYLMKLIHEIGLELRSSAVCTGLRRLRYGHFTLAHALLMKHCDARSIAENIEFCQPIVTESREKQHSDVVQTNRQDDDLEQLKIDKPEDIDDGHEYYNDDEDDDNDLEQLYK